MKNFILSWGFLILAAFLDCYTLYIVKWRANHVGGFEPGSPSAIIQYAFNFLNHYLVWWGVLTFIIGLLMGYIAVTRMDVTVAYPVSVGLHVVITFVFGVALLNEPLGTFKMLGGFLILLGIFLIAQK